MRKKKRTVITVEIDQTLVVKRAGGLLRAWCAGCAAEVAMVTPEEAAVAAATGTQTIYRWVEEKRVHFMETPAGALWLCLPTLLACTSEAFAPSRDEPDITDVPQPPVKR